MLLNLLEQPKPLNIQLVRPMHAWVDGKEQPAAERCGLQFSDQIKDFVVKRSMFSL